MSTPPRRITRINPIERRMSKFLHEPPSIRNAAGAIVTVTTIIVIASGILMRVVDHREYASVWVGMWWALQTVTTVGYGDVTPKNPDGRIVASFVMLEGIAFLAITTAAITSTFVARAASERAEANAAQEDTRQDHEDSRFDDITKRLDRIESMLRTLEPPRGDAQR